MWQDLIAAFCLVLVLEGIIPFLYPERWRNIVQKIALMDNRTLRITGFISMIVGATLLYIIKHTANSA